MATSSNLPAPRPPRRNGWTAERQEAFLKALAASGCVSRACRAVGMSRESAYNLYNRESAASFRRGWEEALDCSLRLVEDGMFSRAIEGVARPIFYQGELVGEYRHFDNRLAMFLLRYRRRHRYADLPPLPPPPVLPGAENDPPDPDEAIGSLAFYLEDLADEPEESPAIDSVNFVNLGGRRGCRRVSLAPPPLPSLPVIVPPQTCALNNRLQVPVMRRTNCSSPEFGSPA